MKTITLKNLFAVTMAMVLVAATSTVSTALAQSNYEPYSFTTLAGIAQAGGDDGTGSHARFNSPFGVAVDSAGNVYVADTYNSTIRKITPFGVVSTLAGLAGSSGSADGTGCAARFDFPTDVAVDNAGNVYVADKNNSTIRKITPSRVVSTLAGLAGSVGSADGTGSHARFNSPSGVAVDSAGNVYVADSANNTIRKITPSRVVSTLAGLAGSSGSADGTGSAARFSFPTGVAVDSAGNVYVADLGNSTIRKITPSRVVSTFAGLAGSNGSADGTGSAARFNFPTGAAVDSAGNVYVADSANSTIRKITPSRVVSTLAGLAGSVGSADGTGSAARFNGPQGVAVDSAGNVYVADLGNNTIRKITSSGVVSTLAGLAGSVGSADGTGSHARFNSPFGVAVDSAGNVYVADSQNSTIRKITPFGVVSTLAGLAGSSGSADGTGSAARFDFPNGVAVDSAGNVYVADSGNDTIRKITPSGVVSTLAGLAGSFGSADGAGGAARFNLPFGVAVDSAGNVYVADTYNDTIRKITPSGVVRTLAGLAGSIGSTDGTGSAARFNQPGGVAVDSTGNVYVADSFNSIIRKITPSRVVSTLAGLAGSIGSADGTGSAARFNFPTSVAMDSAGNVYVADTVNQTIRKITPSGVVSTLAGLAGSIGSVDGTGSAARFYDPQGVAVDSAGNVYVGDSGNNTVRVGVKASPLITTVGQLFVYQLETTGTTSLMVSNVPVGLRFDPQLAAIVGVPTATGTSQVVIIATYPGITTHSPLTITVQPFPPSGPVIASGTSVTARTGDPFSFDVFTTGGSAAARLRATGLPPGLSADPVTGVISGSAATDGSSIVTLTVTDGGFTMTATLQLTFTTDPAIPVITSPRETTLVAGQFFTYTINVPVACDSSEVPTFALIGTLPPGLRFDAATGTISGTYNPGFQNGGIPIAQNQTNAHNSSGKATNPLIYFSPGPGHAVNISTRGVVQTGDNILDGGFIVTGNAPKEVIVRAIGPSLAQHGITNPLPDPTLELHDHTGAQIAYNDNWMDAPNRQAIINSTLAPTDNRESAMIVTLEPGPYTAIVRGKNNTSGVALVEVYDLGTGLDVSSHAQLANISTRGLVQTGANVMIGGFIVRGDMPANVIVLALGPSLAQHGITNPLPDPTLELYNGTGTRIAYNDNWMDAPNKQAIINSGVAPSNNLESAILRSLNPGAYTAIVRGKNNTTGVALVAAYGLP